MKSSRNEVDEKKERREWERLTIVLVAFRVESVPMRVKGRENQRQVQGERCLNLFRFLVNFDDSRRNRELTFRYDFQ